MVFCRGDGLSSAGQKAGGQQGDEGDGFREATDFFNVHNGNGENSRRRRDSVGRWWYPAGVAD